MKKCSCFYFPTENYMKIKTSFCYNYLSLPVKTGKTRHVKGNIPLRPNYLFLGC